MPDETLHSALAALRDEARRLTESGTGSTLLPDPLVIRNRLDSFASYVVEQIDSLLSRFPETGDGWVRLPRIGELVEVECTEGCGGFEARWDGREWRLANGQIHNTENSRWRPLPAPPKADEKETT